MAAVITTLRNSFSPLKFPNFRLYLGGQAVSLIGTWLQVTAQAWVVWQLTGSESALGVVTMLNSLPVLFLSPWAGVWADRLDRRKLLIGTQVGAMLLAFVLAFLTQTNMVQLWHVYTLSFMLGVVAALDMPAQQAFVGDLSGMGEVRKAVNLNILCLQISRVLGPSLAGVIVARLGIAPAFWLNGLSFLAVIATLVLVRSSQVRSSSGSNVNPIRQLGEALNYLRTQPRMLDMYLFAALITLFVFSVVMNILPAVADVVLHGDAETLGALMAASGAGALVSVLIVVPLAQAYKCTGVILLAAAFWMSFWLTVFSHSTVLPLSLLSMFFGSMGAPAVMTMALGLVQVMSPLEMRGRLLSLFTMISFGIQPIASLFIGFMAENIGVQNAIQLNALLLAISAVLILIFRPELRLWEVISDASVITEPAHSVAPAATTSAPEPVTVTMATVAAD
ncbi:MAG: MFS transporter [Anaerolineae bacterium]|nr:MFS transporter [Anaerolineae bacterium]